MNKNGATYVGRVIIALFGFGLLALSIRMKVWWTGDIQIVMVFGALIGLFVG